MVCKQQAIDIDKALKSLEENYELCRKKMPDMSKIQSSLQISSNTASHHLGKLYRSQKSKLTTHKEIVAQMTSACNFATILCDISDPMQLLTSRKEIMNRLEEVENKEIPKIDSINTEFAFTKKYKTAMKQTCFRGHKNLDGKSMGRVGETRTRN